MEKTQEKKTLNEFARILFVIINPAKTMAAVKEKPRYLVPLLISFLAAMFYYFYNFEQILSFSITEALKVYENMGLEMDITTIAEASRQKAMAGGFVQPIGLLVGFLVSAVVVQFVAKFFGAKEDLTFKKCFSMLLYASIIDSIAKIVTAFLYKSTGDMFFTLSLYNLVEHLGILNIESQYIDLLLQSITLFGLWSSLVTAIGLYKIANMNILDSIFTVLVVFVLNAIFVILAQYLSTSAMSAV